MADPGDARQQDEEPTRAELDALALQEHLDAVARSRTNFASHEPLRFTHRANTPPSGPTPSGPEERLEELRFFVIEGEANFKSHLSKWMQEVERQIEELRERFGG